FGDMSLVGPRAYFSFELKEQEDRFPNTKELIKIALTTKPGITGVWQTSGRSAIGFEARIKMDADYATTRSILYDLLIILKTPFVVLSKKGAF
ncbi:sugar transferase, partial [candidate division WWE3 bacterium]|nr:sugar transferase [candidate division WWE3 bacterium]